jgi:hypothetical protein
MFKCGVKIDGKRYRKRRKKAEKGREEREKMTERKMVSMHLLKSLQDRFKCGVKIGGKRARRREK